MKRTTRRPNKAASGIQPEHRFDYTRACANRFAQELQGKVVTVVLEPDVAAVFDSSESVNRLLRSVISAVPERKHRSTTGKSRRKAS